MKKPNNPFVVQGYYGPDYFCNRNEEVQRMTSWLNNDLNITLISGRRKGKSNLIHHLFHSLKQTSIYVDIYRTKSFSDFSKVLTEAVFQQYGSEKTTLLKKASVFLKSIRPVFGYDPISGEPQVSVQQVGEHKGSASVEELLQFLENEKGEFVIAIDEFQEICSWKDEMGEAAFRTLVQNHPGIRFIFSGSDNRLMTEMFTNKKRPFYRSSELLYLQKIERNEYTQFITQHFKKSNGKLPLADIELVLDWCRGETYYVQRICNRLYSERSWSTKLSTREILNRYIEEKTSEFQVQLQLISRNQKDLLESIARDGGVDRPTANDFVQRHHLSSTSTIGQNIQSLLDKDLIELENKTYRVSDVFLEKWLALN